MRLGEWRGADPRRALRQPVAVGGEGDGVGAVRQLLAEAPGDRGDVVIGEGDDVVHDDLLITLEMPSPTRRWVDLRP
jgi:hypothetical protein